MSDENGSLKTSDNTECGLDNINIRNRDHNHKSYYDDSYVEESEEVFADSNDEFLLLTLDSTEKYQYHNVFLIKVMIKNRKAFFE